MNVINLIIFFPLQITALINNINVLASITPEHPTHPTVLRLGLTIGLGLRIMVRVKVRVVRRV